MRHQQPGSTRKVYSHECVDVSGVTAGFRRGSAEIAAKKHALRTLGILLELGHRRISGPMATSTDLAVP